MHILTVCSYMPGQVLSLDEQCTWRDSHFSGKYGFVTVWGIWEKVCCSLCHQWERERERAWLWAHCSSGFVLTSFTFWHKVACLLCVTFVFFYIKKKKWRSCIQQIITLTCPSTVDFIFFPELCNTLTIGMWTLERKWPYSYLPQQLPHVKVKFPVTLNNCTYD